MEWALELVLAGLLLATFLQALRLERSLSAMKKDRGVLETLIAGFRDSTRQAETGLQKLRALTDGAGRKMDAQIAKSTELRQDLAVLMDRAERMAERLEDQLPVSVLAREPMRTERRPVRSDEGHTAEMELLAALRRRSNG